MWTTRCELSSDGRRLRCTILSGELPLNYADVLKHWQEDVEFRSVFNALLAAAPFDAFRWETPPITAATASRPFECMVLDSPGLARPPDVRAFAEHFRTSPGAEIVSFDNLGRTATLIVPCPIGPQSAYGHLAAFVRNGPDTQRQAFWKRLGSEMQRRLNTAPVWLSTAGAGVAWLHARLDDSPKYYGHRPYCVHE